MKFGVVLPGGLATQQLEQASSPRTAAGMGFVWEAGTASTPGACWRRWRAHPPCDARHAC